MATIPSLMSPRPTTAKLVLSAKPSKPIFKLLKPEASFNHFPKLTRLHLTLNSRQTKRFCAAADVAVAADPSSEDARKLYIGNIPRTVNNEELTKIVEEHGAVEKAEVMYDKYSGRSRRFAFVTMKTVEDANAAIEKLNGTEIGGREIKVNITEKPLKKIDLSSFEGEDSLFIDSSHKVYVGNIAKTVTSDSLKNFFSEKGKVLSAKVTREPGTSKSKGFGFVTFSSAEDVDAAISSLNGATLEGQQIRVTKT